MTPIYDRGFVKRGGAGSCVPGLPAHPLRLRIRSLWPISHLSADESVVQPATHPLSPRPRELLVGVDSDEAHCKSPGMGKRTFSEKTRQVFPRLRGSANRRGDLPLIASPFSARGGCPDAGGADDCQIIRAVKRWVSGDPRRWPFGSLQQVPQLHVLWLPEWQATRPRNTMGERRQP